jgi:anti-anti-sigma factor
MTTVLEDNEADVGGSKSEDSSNAMLMPEVRGHLRVALLAARDHQDPIEGLGVTDGHNGALAEVMAGSEDGPQTVRLAGKLDLSTASSVLRRLLEVLDCGEGPLVVDLAGVTFINSSGLLTLEGASRYALQKQRFLSLINARLLAAQLPAFGDSEAALDDREGTGPPGAFSHRLPHGSRGIVRIL